MLENFDSQKCKLITLASCFDQRKKERKKERKKKTMLHFENKKRNIMCKRP